MAVGCVRVGNTVTGYVTSHHSDRLDFRPCFQLPFSIIIIFDTCNWVVTRWQWLFYMYTKYEIGYY